MLKQEQEFKAWGLTRLAVRNIVVFFLIVETLAIMALSKGVREQERKGDDIERVVGETKERGADKMERWKNEQIATIREMGKIIERQTQLEHDIALMNRRVQKIKQ